MCFDRVPRLGERRGDGVDRRRQRGRRVGAVERPLDPGEQGGVGALVHHRPAHVEAQMFSVPSQIVWHCASRQLARHRPVLHVAVAAEELERLARGRDRLARGADLGERHEDAPQHAALRPRRAALRLAAAHSNVSAMPGLELDEEVDERLAHERIAVDPLSPLLAVGGVDRAPRGTSVGGCRDP